MVTRCAVRGERLFGPIARFDNERAAPVLAIDEAYLAFLSELPGGDLAPLRAHGRERAALVVDVAFAADFERAEPIGAGRQGNRQRAALSRLDRELNLDVQCGHRTKQTELAVDDLAHRGRGMKRQLDVAGELTAVVDVARGAMRIAGQTVE